MFEMRRERHSYPSSRKDDLGRWVPEEIWVDDEVMEREDGLQLIRPGEARPSHPDTFHYHKGDVAFRFYATRCHEGGTVTGTYSVGTLFNPGEMLGKDVWPIERAKIEAIAADIDAALRVAGSAVGRAKTDRRGTFFL